MCKKVLEFAFWINALSSFFTWQKGKVFMAGKGMTAGRTLSIGGPDNLLPDTPENILSSTGYNKSIPIIIGITKHDGSFLAGG